MRSIAQELFLPGTLEFQLNYFVKIRIEIKKKKKTFICTQSLKSFFFQVFLNLNSFIKLFCENENRDKKKRKKKLYLRSIVQGLFLPDTLEF